jgi:two-component system chemotaxis response regulator CheY
VLVVDDDAAALELRKLVLERCGHVVTLAADAIAARKALRGSAFDVVITDLRLPEASDGLALIREIIGARIVVLCGDSADIEGREEATMVSAILQKPVRSEALLKALEG